MLFNSIEFVLFFPIITFLYYITPKKYRYILLLVASYFFYMCWEPRFILLIVFSTIVTYFCALLIQKSIHREFVLIMGIVVNIGLLFYFKYFSYFAEVIQSCYAKFNRQYNVHHFEILLPVGISFFIFQALGYMIDVYREEIPAETSLVRYALFVSFFPQLVAGPIERAQNLLTQLREVPEKVKPEYQRIVNSIVLMIWGLFLKMVIADRVSILVDTVFDNYTNYGSVELIIGAVGFAIQIYCDFAGYSTVAIGAAQVLGFKLIENFNVPYMTTSIKEFWRKWHISLSIWFRDYLYIPLGGNRCSKLHKYMNLLITFLVSGLWHGANITYVIWGGLHGLYQVVGEMTFDIRMKILDCFKTPRESASYKLGQMFVTFILVDFAWIFFRAKTVTQGIDYIRRMITQWDIWVLFDGSLYQMGLSVTEWHILFFALVILIMVDILKYKRNMRIDMFLEKQCLWFRWGVLFLLIFSIIVYGEYGINFSSDQFIYFQF